MGWQDAPEVKSEGWKTAPAVDSEVPKGRSATTAERLMGSQAGRVVLGAAAPLIGSFQLGANVGDYIAKQFGLTPVVGQAVADTVAKIEEMKRAGMAPDESDVAGTLASMATGGAAVKGFKVATTLLGRMAQGGAIGAGAGVTTPSETPGIPAQAAQGAVGATLGAAAPVVVPVVAKVARGMYNTVSPFFNPEAVKGNALLEAVGNKGPEVVNALRTSPQIVPGYQQTAGEAATSAGSSGFSALAKGIENASVKSKDAAVAQRDAANAARIAQVRVAGQTPQDLGAAVAARESNAGKLYTEAYKDTVPANAELAALLERPSMKKVLTHAANVAAEKNQPFQIGANAPAQQTPSSILGATGAPASVVNTPAEFAQYPVQSLHFLKQGMDDVIKKPAEFGLTQTEANAIKDTRGELLNWLKVNAPKYETARETFAKDSIPVNQMQLGQYLESKLVPALGEEGKQRAGMFAQAVANAPGTITKAITGAPRYKELSAILNPNQMTAVNSVLKDLSRGARFEELAAAGGKVGNTGLSQASEAIGTVPHILDPKVTIVNAILNRVKGGMDRKLAEQLAETMLDPKLTADALEKAMARQVGLKQTAARARTLQIPTAIGLGQNSLAPAENRNALAR